MKIQMTLLLLLAAFAATAQTTQRDNKKSDTLILSGSALPAAAKLGKDVYKLIKVMPGPKTYSFEFPEPVISALFQFLELSTGPHVQIEQVKNLLREQLKAQLPPS